MKLVITVLLVSVVIPSGGDHVSGDSKDGLVKDHVTDFDILLGNETSRVLSKTDIKKRLEILFRKIDVNQDKRATVDELKDWIYITIMATFWEHTKHLFKKADTDSDGMISWNEVLIFNFGVAEDTNDKQYKDNTQEIEQDQLRFDLADDNNDGLLTVEECFVFLHPELYNHMKDLITWKFFAEYDKDKDGSISLVEYIGKKSRHEEKWVSKANKAKKAFEIIDSNKNGKLEVPEALAVLLPNYHRDAQDEASKIMKNVDENGDGQLSLKEVKKHYKVFTENEHVDFTSQLRRIRDEL